MSLRRRRITTEQLSLLMDKFRERLSALQELRRLTEENYRYLYQAYLNLRDAIARVRARYIADPWLLQSAVVYIDHEQLPYAEAVARASAYGNELRRMGMVLERLYNITSAYEAILARVAGIIPATMSPERAEAEWYIAQAEQAYETLQRAIMAMDRAYEQLAPMASRRGWYRRV